MSVVFVTITDTFIALCADKQATNLKKGCIRNDITKIERWKNGIAVGACGNYFLAKVILDNVKDFLGEDKLVDYTLEEIAGTCCESYYVAREVYDEIPKETVAKVVLAGKLESGVLGVIQIAVGNDKTDMEIIESKATPSTLIFEPNDVSADKCNELFKRAIATTKKAEFGHMDL